MQFFMNPVYSLEESYCCWWCKYEKKWVNYATPTPHTKDEEQVVQ